MLRLLLVIRDRKLLAGATGVVQATVRQIDPGAFVAVDEFNRCSAATSGVDNTKSAV